MASIEGLRALTNAALTGAANPKARLYATKNKNTGDVQFEYSAKPRGFREFVTASKAICAKLELKKLLEFTPGGTQGSEFTKYVSDNNYKHGLRPGEVDKILASIEEKTGGLEVSTVRSSRKDKAEKNEEPQGFLDKVYDKYRDAKDKLKDLTPEAANRRAEIAAMRSIMDDGDQGWDEL